MTAKTITLLAIVFALGAGFTAYADDQAAQGAGTPPEAAATPAAPAAEPQKAPEAGAPASPAAEASPAAPAKTVFVCEKCSVTKDAAGKCEKCGGDLVEKPAPAPEATPAAGDAKPADAKPADAKPAEAKEPEKK